MMKYSLLACLMALIIFSACQEDTSITTETSIEGQWELQGLRFGSDNKEVIALRTDHTLMNIGQRFHGNAMLYTRK